MASTTVEHVLDEARALELIFGDADACCEGIGKECTKDPTHLIACQCGHGSAMLCTDCLSAAHKRCARVLRIGRLRLGRELVFDSSCNHGALIEDCTIRPI